jgi:hypothetical protein
VGGEVCVVKQKAILQYDKDGTFIAEYKSLKEACSCTGANMGSVSNVCTGKRKSANGFKWSYK